MQRVICVALTENALKRPLDPSASVPLGSEKKMEIVTVGSRIMPFLYVSIFGNSCDV